MNRWGAILMLLTGPLMAAPAPAGASSGDASSNGASWLDRVAPVISPSEKKAWLALGVEARPKFEEDFWATRSIPAAEYFRRLEYVDAMWGGGKTGSGANTDQGRVYLAIGAPARVTHIPSSRMFVPLEIWYYDTVPGVIATEVRLVFYRENSTGLEKLYSPTLDTIRKLLLPQASSVHAFGPNDSLLEADIRGVLKPGPGEDEVIPAAVGVAAGVRGSENELILAGIASPRAMLALPVQTKVSSRLISARAKFDYALSPVSYSGAVQADLAWNVKAQRELGLEILAGEIPMAQYRLDLGFAAPRTIDYYHRVDLLPGTYRLVLTVDGTPEVFTLEAPEAGEMGSIARVARIPVEGERAPLNLDREGGFAAVSLARPASVTWRLRQGASVVWRGVSPAASMASVDLPQKLPAGDYQLEAVAGGEIRTAAVHLSPEPHGNAAEPVTVISYNANLAPAARYALVGHEYLVRGDKVGARRALEASLAVEATPALGATAAAQIELARADAIGGKLDAARERVQGILAREPNHFEALSVLAFIETQQQDFAAAAEAYRRALAVQDSPAVRAALSSLPSR
jgi:GWxTD domain-containing protein